MRKDLPPQFEGIIFVGVNNRILRFLSAVIIQTATSTLTRLFGTESRLNRFWITSMASTHTIDQKTFACFVRTAIRSLRPAAVPIKAKSKSLRAVLQRRKAATLTMCFLPRQGVFKSKCPKRFVNSEFQDRAG